MKITPLEGWISRHIGTNGTGLSRERIEAWQLAKLLETIGWAKARSPFYRERLAGLAQEDLTGLEALCAISVHDSGGHPAAAPPVSVRLAK